MRVDVVDTLRQPEYTGENRCEPCTVLNLVLAALFGSAIARKSRVGGVAAVVVSIGLIYLRGYLVPGTPELTKRYLPPEVLRWFGKEPEPEIQTGLTGVVDESDEDESDRDDPSDDRSAVESDDGSAESAGSSESDESGEGLDADVFLDAEGIIEPCADRDDLCLVDEFRTRWEEEIDRLAETDLEAGETTAVLGVGTGDEEVEVREYGDARTLVVDSRTVGKWPSHGALLADVGAARVLEEWSDRWNDLGPAHRGRILNGLRLFIERCPGKEGSVSMNQETVQSCCSSHEVVVVSCDETGDRLFEQRVNTARS